ncbi:DNA-binding protein [Trametes maxima]|nr:DNA-binding protein [Trametes maxima]
MGTRSTMAVTWPRFPSPRRVPGASPSELCSLSALPVVLWLWSCHPRPPPTRRVRPMAGNLPLTFNQAVRGVAEFIEVAIHTILYVRQVYPSDLFVRRRKYDTPVFQSRHPALNEYIAGAVKAVTDELTLGTVDKVVVVIKDADEKPLERFIFALRSTLQVESYNKDTSVEGAITAASLGQYFRSFLVKLSMIEAQLGQLYRDDLSFAILLELEDDKAPTASSDPKEPPPWIPASTPLTTVGTGDAAELHMVRAVDTGIVNLSLAVQESEYKLNLEKESASASKGKQKAT